MAIKNGQYTLKDGSVVLDTDGNFQYNDISIIPGTIEIDKNYSKSIKINVSQVGGNVSTIKGALSDSRIYTSSIPVDGYSYLLAGSSNTGYSTLVERFNDSSGLWTTILETDSSVIDTRYSCASFVLNGYGYFSAGNAISGVGNDNSTTQKYNHVTNIFETKNTIDNRWRLCGQELNNVGYAIGGVDTSTYLSTVESYDDLLDTWTTQTSMNVPKSDTSCFNLNGYLYVSGGTLADISSTNLGQYNDSLDTWTTKTDITIAIRYHSSFALNGFGYTYGGSSNGNITEYNDVKDAWSTAITDSTIRTGCDSFSLNGFGYYLDNTSTNQYSYQYSNSVLYEIIDPFKKSANTPLNVNVTTSINEQNVRLPIIVSSDEFVTNNYILSYEVNKRLKDTITTSLPASSGFRNYKLKVGLPKVDFGDYYVTKQALSNDGVYGCANFSLNGYGYIVGGILDSGFSDKTIQYNIISNTWTEKTVISVSVGLGSAFILNGYAYYTGGTLTDTGSTLDTFYIYNQSADSWAAGAGNLNTSREKHCSFTLNDYGYVAGTNDATDGLTVENYSDATVTWTSKTSMSIARDSHVGFTVDGFGYSVAGYNNVGTANTATVEKYNDSANTWETMNSVNVAKQKITGFVIYNYGYILCGDANEYLEKYNPASDTWIYKAPYTNALEYASSFVLNNTAIQTGGYLSSVYYNNTKQYVPAINISDYILDVNLKVAE